MDVLRQAGVQFVARGEAEANVLRRALHGQELRERVTADRVHGGQEPDQSAHQTLVPAGSTSFHSSLLAGASPRTWKRKA